MKTTVISSIFEMYKPNIVLTPRDAKIVASYFYEIDKRCREDLSKGLLISERDYVSRFTTFAMYPCGILRSAAQHEKDGDKNGEIWRSTNMLKWTHNYL